MQTGKYTLLQVNKDVGKSITEKILSYTRR